MYVDPSAILAILLEDDDASDLRQRLAASFNPVMSVVGKVEAALSLGQKLQDYDVARESITQFCDEAGISILPVQPSIYDDVLKAYRRFGKGTGHPAKLNFGDCFSYAFAKANDQPILFKGDDFKRTDLRFA